MKQINRILDEVKNTKRPKNLKHEFQFYGCSICEILEDTSRYPLYIKLAKIHERHLLEQALNFVKDYPAAKSKPKLFMWKLKQLREEQKLAKSVASSALV